MLKQEACDFPWMFFQVSHGILCVLLLITEDPSPVACTVYRMGRFSWADALSASKEKHLLQVVWQSSCESVNASIKISMLSICPFTEFLWQPALH